jgi:hypothetical protein
MSFWIKIDICGVDEKKETFQIDSKVIFQKVFRNVTVQVIQGDILQEEVDVVGKIWEKAISL